LADLCLNPSELSADVGLMEAEEAANLPQLKTLFVA